MTQYFRKVVDPQRLLARERAPVTGRRVPKVRSKRTQATQATSATASAGVPVAAVVAGAVVAVLAVVGVVAAIAKSSGSDETAGPTTITVPEAAPTAAVASPITTVATTSTNQPGTTVGVTSTRSTTSTTLVIGPVVRLVSAAAATAATIIPTDPAASADFAGPLPVFNFAIDCAANGCNFSMRAFAPGTVSDQGLTTVPATAGRFVITSTRAATCTTSSGGQLSREVSSVIDLTLSGSQVVTGVSVPSQIAGTLTTVIPDAGYVPKVGDAVNEGAEVGCAGQTMVFDVAGALAPG